MVDQYDVRTMMVLATYLGASLAGVDPEPKSHTGLDPKPRSHTGLDPVSTFIE